MDIANKISDPKMVHLAIDAILNCLAICNRELGYLDHALKLGLESMSIARNTDVRYVLVQALVRIGEVYVRQREYEQAGRYLRDA